MKRIKVRTFINAIRKNGYTKTQGAYIHRKGGVVISACAYGQAALNLHLHPERLNQAVSVISTTLAGTVLNLNDNSSRTMPEIADELEKRFPEFLDKFIVYEGP